MAKDTVEQVCNDMTERANCLLDEYGHSGEDHLLEYANELHEFASRVEVSFAAHNREIAAKDAEIARLRALVKEIADDLSGYLCESECNGACTSFGHCCSQTSRQIVAKAREAVSKTETTTEVCHA